jgi:ATP-binding cassette subfamily B protein/ATP-binding cassette subfamily C protein
MQIYRKLLWFFKEHKRLYIIGLVFLLLTELLQMLPPILIGRTIDIIVGGDLTMTTLLLAVGGLLALYIVMNIFRYGWEVHIFQGSTLLERTLRQKLFSHYMRMDTVFYQKYRTGELMAHATNDLSAVQRVASGGVLMSVDSVVMIVLTVLTMAVVTDWRLTLMGVLPLPLLGIGVFYLVPRIRDAFTRSQEAFSELSNKTQESVQGIKAIKTLGQAQQDTEAFAQKVEETVAINRRVAFLDALFEPLATSVMTISYVVMIVVGGRLVLDQTLTIGQLVSFSMYLGLLVWPMFALGQLFNVLERGNASYDRVANILAQRSSQVVAQDGVTAPVQGDLQIDVDNFAYPDAQQSALQDIHVTVKAGQTLGIVGKVGAGKTTLLQLVLRQFDHYDGQIKVGGHAIQSYHLDTYMPALGYVPQENFLFSTTIRDNIRFADQTTSQERVEAVAQKAALHEDILGLPAQYDTEVGEQGISLSGGQRQRLAIARALIVDPAILILDDALSAVDARTEKAILAALKAERQDKTTIIAAHRLSSVMSADEIIVLDNGRIIERGTHEQLMAANGWYAQMFVQQQLQAALKAELEGEDE